MLTHNLLSAASSISIFRQKSAKPDEPLISSYSQSLVIRYAPENMSSSWVVRGKWRLKI